MSKELQTILITGSLILVFGVGFIVGFLVKGNANHDPHYMDSGMGAEFSIPDFPLSEAGKRVATGLLPACGSTEPLLEHKNCMVANEMRRMIESLLDSGLSEEDTRQALINFYGNRILMPEQ